MTAYAYRRIADDIQASIEDGTLAPGASLPTTSELCATYGVSKITVKRAMDELVRDGLVVRRRGAGTFVRTQGGPQHVRRREWVVEDQMDGMDALCAERGLTLTVRLIDFELTYPTVEEARALRLGDSEPCFRFRRTLLADGVPLMEVTDVIPFMRAPELTEHDVEHSLRSYVRDALGLTLASTHRKIEAAHPDEGEAARLGITVSTAVLRVTQVGYLDDGRAITYSRALHAPDFEYRATRYS